MDLGKITVGFSLHFYSVWFLEWQRSKKMAGSAEVESESGGTGWKTGFYFNPENFPHMAVISYVM